MPYNKIFAGTLRKKKKSVSASTDSLSTAEIFNIVEHLKAQRCRDSTHKTYHRIWKLFAHFYLRLDVKPNNWEDRLVLFIAFLVNNNLRSAMVKTYISAIQGVLAVEGIRLQEDQFLLTSLTRACRLQKDKVVHRLPIYKELLHLILGRIELNFENNQQEYLAKLYKAIFIAGYYGLLRAGEMALSPHVLLAKDVHIGKNKNKLLFILWSSKTHDYSQKPQMIKISSVPSSVTASHKAKNKPPTYRAYCPFEVLWEYIAIRPDARTESEQFFIYRDHSCVTPERLRAILKLMMTQLNFQASLYNLHSLHIGRCCDLYKYGLSVKMIKKIGRWKSNAIYVYLRH